jgi:hypothetical protein
MPTTLFATRGRLGPEANPKSFDLQHFVPFLMARVGSLMALSFTPHLQRRGVTMHMWRVVLVLYFDGPMTLVEISRLTGLNTSTLSRLVGRMIYKRLLTRQRSQSPGFGHRSLLGGRGQNPQGDAAADRIDIGGSA